MINKKLSIILTTVSLMIVSSQPFSPIAIAESCVAETSCGPQPIEFEPGKWINIEIVNLTRSLVEIQQVNATDPVPVSPGEIVSLGASGNTKPNFSLIFADVTGLSLKLNLVKVEKQKLRIEIRPGGRPPGDRSLYIKNDGHIQVF